MEGLEGLSIGRLAEHVGMSKSGLYAHFGSKEELQLATVDTARRSAPRGRGPGAPPRRGVAGACAVRGVPEQLVRGVFPGGCFFISAAAELDAKEGVVSDHLREVYSGMIEGLAAGAERRWSSGERRRRGRRAAGVRARLAAARREHRVRLLRGSQRPGPRPPRDERAAGAKDASRAPPLGRASGAGRARLSRGLTRRCASAFRRERRSKTYHPGRDAKLGRPDSAVRSGERSLHQQATVPRWTLPLPS